MDWITKALLERQDKIGRYHLSRVLPLEEIAIRDSKIQFVDLEIARGYVAARKYQYQWSRFDNRTATKTRLAGAAATAELPAAVVQAPVGSYFVVDITAERRGQVVSCFFRKTTAGYQLAGVERLW